LRVFEKDMLKPKSAEKQEAEENFKMRRFTNFALHFVTTGVTVCEHVA
jgi:hypothetical protein